MTLGEVLPNFQFYDSRGRARGSCTMVNPYTTHWLLPIVLWDYNAAFLYNCWFSFILMGLLIWAVLTRGHCRVFHIWSCIIILRWPSRPVSLLFISWFDLHIFLLFENNGPRRWRSRCKNGKERTRIVFSRDVKQLNTEAWRMIADRREWQLRIPAAKDLSRSDCSTAKRPATGASVTGHRRWQL